MATHDEFLAHYVGLETREQLEHALHVGGVSKPFADLIRTRWLKAHPDAPNYLDDSPGGNHPSAVPHEVYYDDNHDHHHAAPAVNPQKEVRKVVDEKTAGFLNQNR